jgi:hypothetical protein
MKKLIILFILIANISFGQFGKLTVPEPPYVINLSADYATLTKKKKGATYIWNYYKSDGVGSLNWPRWRVLGYSPTDSTDAVTTLPASWVAYTAPCTILDFEKLAVWLTTGDTLKARFFGDSLVLTQSVSSNPDAFIVRGYNFYNYEGMTHLRTIDSACLASNFNYGTTDIGGLYEPSGFIIPSGYTLYYTEDSTKIYSNASYGGEVASSGLIPNYTITTLADSVNLVQFPDITGKTGLSFVFGQGSPYFADMQTTPQLPLKKGWNYTYTGGLVSSSVVPSANIGAFFDLTQTLVSISAEPGVLSQYPSLSNVTSDPSPSLNQVTNSDAFNLGATAFYYRKDYKGDRIISSMLLDEESWFYPDGQMQFMGAVMKGYSAAISNFTGNRQIVLYGNNYSPTDFRRGKVTPYPNGYTPAELNTSATTFNLDNIDFKTSKALVDFAVMYHKTPIPDTSTYYARSGGTYTLVDGKRQLRTDAFTETLLGVSTNFYTTWSATYEANVGVSHYVELVDRRSDVYWAIAQQYRHHDMLQMGLKARAVSYGHMGDITYRYSEGIQPYAVLRLETEPYTTGGNGHDIRELGEAGVLEYCTVTGFMMNGFETWQDGTGSQVYVGNEYSPYQTNPAQGDSLYGKSNHYGRFEVATAAIQGINKAYEGITIDDNLRYFHFSKYYDSYVNKEILSSGFYNNGKLGIYLLYPFHDATDSTEVTIRLGDTIIKTLTLVGRKPVIYNWAIDATVSPTNMSIEYTNIDGTVIHVKGDIEDRDF